MHPSQQPFDLIAADMEAVNQVITAKLQTEVPLVGSICRYIVSAGGKRIRPALHLLMCGALQASSPDRHKLAAVVEFIHTATLLHDDVVDESRLRRGRDTANEVFGNAASVLVGDFLYSRSFQMMVELGNMRIMEVLAEATNVIAEGEVQQLVNIRDPELTEATYLQVIRSKTAKLFEASTRLAAILANQPKEIEDACATYGQSLGTAYQVIDDVLDYEGDTRAMGKNLGDDLREGKVTLPMIHALKSATASEREALIQAITSEGTQSLDEIFRIIEKTGAIGRSRETAMAEANRAINSLSGFADSPFKETLVNLAQGLQNRNA